MPTDTEPKPAATPETATLEGEPTETATNENDAGQAVTAALVDPTDATGLPTEWHACLGVEGLRTQDHRLLTPGGMVFRQLPLPLMAQFNNDGHSGAPVVGSITTVERDANTGQIMASGTFDLTLEEGRQAAAMCANQTLRWGSLDLQVIESKYVEIGGGGGDDILDILFGDGPGDDDYDWYDEYLESVLLGWTMLPIPAFPQAVIAPMSVELDIPEPMSTGPVVSEGMIAAAIQPPVDPPASWFDNPELQGPTDFTIEDDGRVFGHVATWKVPHIGITGQKVFAPKSTTDYAYFKTGYIVCEDGTKVGIGHITFETGHAEVRDDKKRPVGWQAALSHYDNTGTVAADVNVGEDEFGIWIAGALRPNLNGEAIRALRAAPLSGDWRPVGKTLEMVAALAVNVPGFPLVASARYEVNGETLALVAGGRKQLSPIQEIAFQLRQLREAVAPLLPDVVAKLDARVNGPKREATFNNVVELRKRVNQEQDA